jgi:glycosyltransferase involved in cell wall biosynthesis
MATNPARLAVAEVMECTIGGTRRHIGELSIGLAGRGVDVTLFASAVRDPTFRQDLARCAAAGVRIVEIPMRREIAPLHDLRHALRLVREFAARRFDVIHTHSSKAGALGRVAARIAARDAAIVHTPHTFAFNFAEQFSPRKRKLFLAIERGLGRVTDRLIHVSESERREGIALGIVPAERAIVIENGIDAASYAGRDRSRVRREFGIADDEPLIGAVGLLNEAKGHSYLIDAIATLRGRGSRARGLIVGEGALRADLERRIRDLSLGDAVILAGYRRDVPDVLAALDVFAMPSLWEGMPYGVLEAMAAQKPVVASDVNGCRDLVRDGETGFLVPPRDPSALAAALERVLRDRERAAALAAAGRELVAREYSLATMIDRYVALFDSLAREKGRGCASST